MTTERKLIPEKKRRMFEEFVKLLRDNKYLILVDAHKCKASIINEARSLQERLNFKLRGGKNNILRLALREVYPESAELIESNLSGENVFIFTNEDPFELVFKLGELRVELPASPGDVATSDIVITEGNTGLQPGPVISLFSACKVPTKIIGGAIHVTRNTVVARKGETVSMNLASLLSKLGVRPIEGRLSFRLGLDLERGLIIPGEMLRIDVVSENKEMIRQAFVDAFKLSVELEYVTSINVAFMISVSAARAMKVAEEAGYLATETLPIFLMKAVNVAVRVFNLVDLPEKAS